MWKTQCGTLALALPGTAKSSTAGDTIRGGQCPLNPGQRHAPLTRHFTLAALAALAERPSLRKMPWQNARLLAAYAPHFHCSTCWSRCSTDIPLAGHVRNSSMFGSLKAEYYHRARDLLYKLCCTNPRFPLRRKSLWTPGLVPTTQTLKSSTLTTTSNALITPSYRSIDTPSATSLLRGVKKQNAPPCLALSLCRGPSRPAVGAPASSAHSPQSMHRK